MWGRALRLFTGVGGGEAAELLELGQSLTLWAVGPATDSAAPPLPTPARLTRPWKHRLAALRWGAPQYPSLSFPAHSTSGPPLTLERHRELSQGGLGKFPGPLCQEVPGAPARQPPPPEGGARGRCPMERGGAVCSRSRDPSRSCVSQPPRPPRIMRRRP